jgi:hypothetical protein
MKIFLLLIAFFNFSSFALPIANFFAESSIVHEQSRAVRLSIELTETSEQLISIPIIVSGNANVIEDHNLLNGNVYITPGTRRGILSFELYNNSSNELDYETIDIELLAPVNSMLGETSKHTLTIVDSTVVLPGVGFTQFRQLTKEGDTVTVTAQLTQASSEMIIAPFSVSGSSSFPDDHDAVNGSFVFMPGEVQSSLNIQISEDMLDDDGETLVLTMMGPISNAIPSMVTQQEIVLEINCPLGYEKVRANPLVGTNNDFCVAKYEMKDVAGVPTSQPSLTPWTNISQEQAISHCSSLGPNYHLITNEEWMTVARSIETNPVNYSTNANSFNRGNAYVGGALKEASSDDDPCHGTSASCSDTLWNVQKRTHTLSSGGVIWDISGNGWEWVNTIVTDKPSKVDSFVEVNAPFPTANFPATSYKSLDETLNSTHGIGKFFGGTSPNGAVSRGGSTASTTTAGIYAAYLDLPPTFVGNGWAFRCVYSLIL